MSDEFQPIPGTTVVGIGHKARHGKDTAAAAIVREIEGAMRFSFADDLYAYCRIVHGMQGKDAPLLQRVGVEMREKDPDIWIKSVYSKILDARPTVAVISDVRFPNEIDFVRKLGGFTMKVHRYNADLTSFVDPSRPADHPSETALDKALWNLVIGNREGHKEAFEQGAVAWVDWFLSQQQQQGPRA